MNSTSANDSPRSFSRRLPHRGLLPEGRYYTLTWTIGYDFGGMTTVALARSSAFARLDNRRVDILTLSPEMKGMDRERELRDGRQIDRRVRVRNLWRELTSWSDRKLRRMVGTIDTDFSAADDVLKRTGKEWSEQRHDSNDRLLQSDRYHDRGHLLIIDRQDMKKRGRRGGRRITLFDREQRIIAQWATAREFYQAWLDVVIGTKPSYLICDSAFVGNFIHGYRRENIILCQVVHSHFVDDVTGDHLGVMSEDKFGLLRHLDAFDVVAILTDGQRNDMSSLNLAARSMKTVSNLTENLHGDSTLPRPRGKGAMIARLAPVKRVEDAVHAMAKVGASNEANATLDIYGEGEERPLLETLIDGKGAQSRVHLHGHTPGAKSKFLTSSFSLLTSHSEGQALVVAEGMSAGCIPICYDIDYRPSEIVDHGINGFIVPNGDVDAMSEAILEFLNMPENDVRRMRAKAIERAADFSEDAIIRRWGQVLAEQSFAPITRLKGVTAKLREAVVTADGIAITTALSGIGGTFLDDAFISWKSRTGNFYGRIGADISNGTVKAEVPMTRISRITEEYLDFSLDLVARRGFTRVRISSDDGSIVNRPGQLKLYTTKHGNLSGQMLEDQGDAAADASELTSTS